MKYSTVLATALFGSLAAALPAPFEKRDLSTKTEVKVETVVIFTTVWDDELPIETAEATATSAGAFYEQPQAQPTTTTTAAAAPVVVNTPAAAPSVETPAPAPQAPTTTAAPVEQPQPTTTEAPKAPEPTTTTTQAAAPAQTTQASSGGSTSSGEKFSDVDITIYDNNGGYGACGTILHDSDMIVALAQPAWGASTYNVMTGAATNPWCGQKINVEYQGKTIEATIMDMCPGCVGHDIDLSLSAWKALTGLDEKTRLKASWSKAS